MLPWISWRFFLFGTGTPGNGGPLLQPRGQTSVLYRVPPPLAPTEQQAAAAAAGKEQAAGEGGEVPAPQHEQQQQQQLK